MKYHIIAMRDIKANLHKPPIFVPNINVAIRDITDMVNMAEGKEDWQRHPEDFELWQLGTWDHETAVFEGEPRKQLLALSTLKQ